MFQFYVLVAWLNFQLLLMNLRFESCLTFVYLLLLPHVRCTAGIALGTFLQCRNKAQMKVICESQHFFCKILHSLIFWSLFLSKEQTKKVNFCSLPPAQCIRSNGASPCSTGCRGNARKMSFLTKREEKKNPKSNCLHFLLVQHAKAQTDAFLHTWFSEEA